MHSKHFAAFLFVFGAGLGGAAACSFIETSIRYDTLAPGEVRVTERYREYMLQKPDSVVYRERVLGVSLESEFKAHLQASLQDSALAFIARIDSVRYYYAAADTVQPEIVPAFVLAPRYSGRWPFFARVQVDTLFRGSLPGKTFWIRGALEGTSCDIGITAHRRFFQASNGLSKMTDLKLPFFMTPHHNVPTAEWFDGRYLVSPKFPGLRLDITTVLPTYPATGVSPRRSPTAPQKNSGKAWQPNGRAAARDTWKIVAPVVK